MAAGVRLHFFLRNNSVHSEKERPPHSRKRDYTTAVVSPERLYRTAVAAGDKRKRLEEILMSGAIENGWGYPKDHYDYDLRD